MNVWRNLDGVSSGCILICGILRGRGWCPRQAAGVQLGL